MYRSYIFKGTIQPFIHFQQASNFSLQMQIFYYSFYTSCQPTYLQHHYPLSIYMNRKFPLNFANVGFLQNDIVFSEVYSYLQAAESDSNSNLFQLKPFANLQTNTCCSDFRLNVKLQILGTRRGKKNSQIELYNVNQINCK